MEGGLFLLPASPLARLLSFRPLSLARSALIHSLPYAAQRFLNIAQPVCLGQLCLLVFP